MSYLEHQVRITPISPPHSYYYQNELGSSPWLKHLATTTQLSQSFPRAKAVPLPHLHHHDMAKVSPSNKYQKVTSVLALHNRHEIEAKVALKSFQQEATPSSSDHLPKIFPSCDNSTDNLLSLNQSLSSPSFSDNKAEFSPFLSHGSMIEKGIYPDFQGKDKLSVISMSSGNQTKVARRPQSQVRATTATTLGNLDLRHTASITSSSSLCFNHWSRATASKTPEVDHWIQAKASKMSYPDLHLRDTVSLLRCIDHHSRPLTDYSLHLNQKTRATTTNSSCPKRCIKGKALPSPAPNHRARTRATSSQSVKSWDKGSANHWVTATSVPFPLHHQMHDVPIKQDSSQCTLHHQATCPPTPEYYQAKYVTDPNTHVLLQKEKNRTEVMPQDLDYQFTMLTGQVYWSTSSVNMEYNDTASFDYYQRTTTPFSARYQTECEPDPQPQITLQTERKNDWERISVGSDYEVTHFTDQDQWATPSHPQNRTVSGSEHQTISLSSNDHQAEDIAVDSNTQVIFQQEQDKWETYWMKDQKSSHPSSVDHHAQEIPGDPRDPITFQQELEKWKIQDPKLTPSSSNGHQAEAIPADHKTQVIFHQELDKWEKIWKKGQNNQSTSPPNNDQQTQNVPEDPRVHIILKGEPYDQDKFCTARLDHQPILSSGNDHQIQDMPADHNAQVIFHQEEGKHETFWTQGQNHQSTPSLNTDYQVQDTPKDPSAHVTFKQEPENLDTFWTKGLDQQPTSSPGNKWETEDKPDFNSKTTLQQKIEEWKILWPGEPDKQISLKYQDETSPETNHISTSPPSCGEQASDVAEFSIQATLQQKIGKRETFWSTEPDKQATTVTDQEYWATSPWDIKHQGRISPDLHHGVIPVITHEDQDSDVPDLSPHVTLPQELDKREIFWSLELDKQATILKDQEFWATSPWDIKQQDRTSPDLHHGDTPLPINKDQDSDVSDLNVRVTLQQELGKRETFWQTELDKQATIPKDQDYWVTTLWNIKQQDRTSPDLHHGHTPLPTNKDQDSDVSDLSVRVTLQQELGKRETFWQTELDKQATIPKDQDYWVTTLWDIKQQDRTSPDLNHVSTSLPTHEDEDSDISDLSDQVTPQQELGKRETFWPIKLDKQAITLKGQDNWVTTLWDIKQQDRTSPDLHHGATPLSTHEDEDSDVSDLSDQVVTLQQELGKRETFWQTELDKQATTLKGQDYWVTTLWDIKDKDRISPDFHHGTTSLPIHEDQDSDVSDLSDQVTLQQELGERGTFWPREPDKQATTLKDQDYWVTTLWDIKHQDRTSPDLHHGATPLSRHKDQDPDVSDLSAQFTLQQELSKRETSYPTEIEKQATILKDKVYWATPTLDLKHEERTSPDLHHGATSSLSYEDQDSDAIDLSEQVIIQQKLGKRKTSCPTESDKKVASLTDPDYWATFPWDIKHQDRTSLDHPHGATPPLSHEDQDSDATDLSSPTTLQQELSKKEISCPTELDKQVTSLTDRDYWTTFPWDIKHQDRTSLDHHHGATPPLTHEDQDSDVTDPSLPTTLQQKLSKKETSCPTEQDKQVTNLTDKDYWATSPWDIKHQDRKSLDFHHKATTPSSHGDKTSNISDLSAHAILQQEQGKRETFWSTEVDQQATTLTDKVYWTTPTLDLNHEDRISLDFHHEVTHPPRNEVQDSDADDLSAQATLQQELSKKKTSCPKEVDQQAITLIDEVCWTTLPWDIKHQDRTFPDPYLEVTSAPRHEDQDSDVSELSTQTIIQPELNEWKTFWPREVNRQVTTLPDKVYWITPMLDPKYLDRTSPDLHHEITPPSSYEEQDSDFIYLNGQATLQQELDKRETSSPTELDQQARTLKDEVSWATLSWDRTSSATPHEPTSPSSLEDDSSAISDLSAQSILQEELDKWKTSCPTELDQQARILKDEVSWATSSWGIKHPDRNSPDNHLEATPSSNHDYQDSDLSDFSAQETLQLGINEWEKLWPTELDQEGTTLPNQTSWEMSPWDIKQQDRTSPDTDHRTSTSSSHEKKDGDVPDLNVEAIPQPKLDQWEIKPSVLDQDLRADLTIQHSRTVPSISIIESQNVILSDPEHQIIPPSSNDYPVGDISKPNTKITFQQGQDDWDIFWTRLDHQDTASLNNDYQVQHISGPKADIIQKEQEDLDIFWTRTLEYSSMTPTNQDYWTAFPLLNIEHHNIIQPDPDHQASCTTSPDHQAGDTTDPNVQSIFQTKKDSWETMPQEIEHKTLILTAHDQEAIFLLGKNHQDTNLPGSDNQDFILSIHDTEDTDVPGPNTLVTIQPEKGHWELMPPETDHMAIISFTVHQQEATPSLALNHKDTNPSNYPLGSYFTDHLVCH
ncbi:uncharacterized protein LOC127554203 [Antechinus flavipes]|uniref:uncharacterized protein LOC127554203 n=1 Tax=Antechinus flavipes TaxID=38775 RepID=UPI00223552C8|nr:uncharacterized protein LOC127554203 [Antechinus flavipes]